jgi:hypothetical protein
VRHTLHSSQLLLLWALLFILAPVAPAQGRSLENNPELADFFESEVSRIEQQQELTRYETLEAWEARRPVLRQQLFDMLGLAPLPTKSPLTPVVTGITDHEEFLVERLHFQSLPGLYVTANLYRPKQQSEPLPAILYVCGHGRVKQDGISYGNKTHYHHHGSWFARNGYVCLTIDTLQLGEIEGVHHGTHNLNRWWWNSRGYTPAGVEAWNCIRALDYLETRTEVDAKRLGVTGRSGGGAYSWWIAALDDRIQCAVPVAGITSMRDHIVEGCIEGHCDCMYMVNFHRWDFATVAALVAPRPLLISNTDKDGIFPLEGVVDIHRQTRHIYRLYKADNQLGLQITEGPHEDTQELHIHAFRWFNRFFRNDKSLIEKTAAKFFQPQQLRVFTELPADERNTRIDEAFVPPAPIPPESEILQNQDSLANTVRSQLLNRSFQAWPTAETTLNQPTATPLLPTNANPDNAHGTRLLFESQPFVPLQLDVLHQPNLKLKDIQHLELVVSLNPAATQAPIAATTPPSDNAARAFFVPRPGIDRLWQGDPAKHIQIARRFQLLGMTIDSMRTWDIRRALQILRQQCPNAKSVTIRADEGTEFLVLLAALYEPPADQLVLPNLNPALEQQPSILNLTRTIPLELLPILAARSTEIITHTPPAQTPLAAAVTANDLWKGKQIRFLSKPQASSASPQ